MNPRVHIADADGLIAMLSKNDANHEKAKVIIKDVTSKGEKILFPATAITEAITTMQVRLENPVLAKELAAKVAASQLPIVPVDAEILEIAAGLYSPTGSKKHTMFDATIAATAKKLGTGTLFSFDGWYRGKGFTLLVDQL
jgi:predicted nucleic acid-binding protein